MPPVSLPLHPDSDTIPHKMIREAVLRKMEERGWTLYRLAKESGVSYARLYGWLDDNPKRDTKKGVRSDNLEAVFVALGLTVSDVSAPPPPKPKRKAKP